MSERRACTIRLDPEVMARLRAEADDRDVTVNWLITRAVEQLLDRLAPVPEWRGSLTLTTRAPERATVHHVWPITPLPGLLDTCDGAGGVEADSGR